MTPNDGRNGSPLDSPKPSEYNQQVRRGLSPPSFPQSERVPVPTGTRVLVDDPVDDPVDDIFVDRLYLQSETGLVS